MHHPNDRQKGQLGEYTSVNDSLPVTYERPAFSVSKALREINPLNRRFMLSPGHWQRERNVSWICLSGVLVLLLLSAILFLWSSTLLHHIVCGLNLVAILMVGGLHLRKLWLLESSYTEFQSKYALMHRIGHDEVQKPSLPEDS